MAIELSQEASENERILAGWTRERATGLTGTAVTLTYVPIGGVEQVALNGVVLDAAHATWGYTVDDRTVTLGSALVATDVVVVTYLARSN